MEAAVTEAARRVGYYAYVDDGKVVQVYTYEDGRSTPVSPQVLTPWIPSPVSDHCSMRCIVGTSQDPPYRVAFIEKTPRVRVKFDDGDMSAWESGPKGTGGPVTPDNTAEQQGIYGYDPESRAWCDQRLRELGYLLPEDHPLLDLATQPPPEPAEPTQEAVSAEPPEPPLVLKEERFTLSKFKRELPVKLSELQLAIKAGAAGDAFEIARGHREKEELAKVTAKFHKDEAERAEEIGRQHMLAYHQGTEVQQVDCEKVLVWLTKEVQIIRKDTGALVDRRAATAEEIQGVKQPDLLPGAKEKPSKEEATEKKGKKRGRKKKEPTLQ